MKCFAVREFAGAIQKPIFFDMVHSNNAARVRLWIAMKKMEDKIETRMVTYPDLQSEEFARVNPLKKVPAFINEEGTTVFESSVILGYLDDKYSGSLPDLMPATPEGRALVHLFMRVHDLYIASPNCSQPGFSHTQGSMYLSPYETKWCAAVRCMDNATRAAKLAEIWKQMTWVENNIKGPYMAGSQITLADCTWFPTAIFMEFMLPRVFGWPALFHEQEHFPKLAAWFGELMKDPRFQKVRSEIFAFWEGKEEEGQFESIKEVVAADKEFKWKYP